jgi:apolipoprotein N-acyltransferase
MIDPFSLGGNILVFLLSLPIVGMMIYGTLGGMLILWRVFRGQPLPRKAQTIAGCYFGSIALQLFFWLVFSFIRSLNLP